MPPKAAGKKVDAAKVVGKKAAVGDRKKRKSETQGKLCPVHLQSSEASSPRYWYLQQGDGNHELLRE